MPEETRATKTCGMIKGVGLAIWPKPRRIATGRATRKDKQVAKQINQDVRRRRPLLGY